MIKLIVCVKSCQAHRNRGDHDVIRSTWGQDLKALGVETRFFVGKSTHETKLIRYVPDEVVLDCPDDYNSLPYKTRSICRWAAGKMLDYILVCDTDTYLKPKKVLNCGYETADYVGKIDRPLGKTFRYDALTREGAHEVWERCYPWASGGYGYFLSRRAIGEVLYESPSSWAEDLWIGQLMGAAMATGTIVGVSLPAGAYSDHFPSSTFKQGYEPSTKWMEQQHEANR